MTVLDNDFTSLVSRGEADDEGAKHARDFRGANGHVNARNDR